MVPLYMFIEIQNTQGLYKIYTHNIHTNIYTYIYNIYYPPINTYNISINTYVYYVYLIIYIIFLYTNKYTIYIQYMHGIGHLFLIWACTFLHTIYTHNIHTNKYILYMQYIIYLYIIIYII